MIAFLLIALYVLCMSPCKGRIAEDKIEPTHRKLGSFSDIVTTAVELGSFTTLAAAITAADLVGALSSPTDLYTVFAPTDAAFSLLPDGLVDCLLKEENKGALKSILLYHVAIGVAPSTALKGGQVIETLNGESVTVDLISGVKINDSVVLLADVMVSNGIIHVVDSVLVPPSVDVTAFLSIC